MAGVTGFGIEYQVPEWFNLATMLVDRHVADGRADHPAIYSEDQMLTYAELLAATNRVGNVLLQLGVRREDRVALLLPDCPAFVASFLGAMKIGAVPLPLNTQLTPAKLAYCLSDSRAGILIIHVDLLPVFHGIGGALHDSPKVLVVGAPRTATVPPWALSFEDACSEASTILEAVRTHRDDPSYWLYSSGTTGPAKGVIHLHQDMIHCVGRWMEAMEMPSDEDLVYSVSKLPFSFGLVNSLYAPLLAGAAVLLDPEPFSPEHTARLVARHHPTRLYGSPVHYNRILHACETEALEFDTTSIRTCISAGETLPASMYHRWKERFELELLDGIGSTECGYIYIQNLPGHSRPGCSGQLLPGYSVELRDEQGQPLLEGEPGELYLQSSSTAIGYWRKRALTKETFCGAWLKTGDLYRRDADGYFAYLGRAGDVFKTNGQFISPGEVEDVLREHSAVVDAAVIGASDVDGLTKPKAFVVLQPGVVERTELVRELQDHCKAGLAPDYYKYPRWITFIDEIPRNENAKIQRSLLHEL